VLQQQRLSAHRGELLTDLDYLPKYNINLKPAADINPVRAFMTISVEGKKAGSVARVLRGHPEVVALHNTNGRWDLVAEIRTDSLESFNRLLGDIRLIDGVSSAETNLLLDTLVV